MDRRTVIFDRKHLQYFKTLQTNVEKVEFNGEVQFDGNGRITNVTAQQGQTVDVCTKGCHINYHTHPEDYVRYYPNHPSLTDMEYILFAVARTRELSVHMVFTPLFIYIMTLSADVRNRLQRGVLAEQAITEQLRSHFQSVANLDRNSERFRDAWIGGLRRIGLLIERHGDYNTPFQVYLDAVNSSTIHIVAADKRESRPIGRLYLLIAFVLVVILVLWLWTKNKERHR